MRGFGVFFVCFEILDPIPPQTIRRLFFSDIFNSLNVSSIKYFQFFYYKKIIKNKKLNI